MGFDLEGFFFAEHLKVKAFGIIFFWLASSPKNSVMTGCFILDTLLLISPSILVRISALQLDFFRVSLGSLVDFFIWYRAYLSIWLFMGRTCWIWISSSFRVFVIFLFFCYWILHSILFSCSQNYSFFYFLFYIYFLVGWVFIFSF